MTLTNDQLNDFENLAWDIGGEVYENYSGRGMYGKTCMGITVEELENCLFRLGRMSGELDSELSKALENFRTDSLGRSFIIYFPKIQKAVDGE
ncbi:MAG: hypothetical protein FMNOHCHN_03500 [Ignavibacteriaceae bacterium]|nr:hypothetical protein [Ignavibacteriaceae bacterium]